MSAAAPGSALLELAGVGPTLARRFEALGIRTLGELARTYPRDYKDWRTPLSAAEVVRRTLALERSAGPDSGARRPVVLEAIVVGTIRTLAKPHARIPLVQAEIEDDSGRLALVWFGRRGLGERLAVGMRVFAHGRAALHRRGGALRVELNVLAHRILAEGEPYRGAIAPVYPASKELPSRTIATTIARNRERLAATLDEVLPSALLRARRYPPLREAWRTLHAPATPEAALAARERLLYDDFFAAALAGALRKAERERLGGAAILQAPGDLLARFEASLPFGLTAAQRRTIGEIWAEMGRSAPMNRLLHGDVGSGKTLVAAAAVLLAAQAGAQSALMAPTEILAAQHARKLAPLLLPFGVRVDAFFGSIGGEARRSARARLESGECELAIGTHALLVEGVSFANLGLAIIDEQHRFGVAQRAQLRAKSRAPHTLHMSATPIPRTLAQIKYADLDLSVLDELPPGRTPVETFVLRASRKPLAYEFVRKNVQQGRQAYVVVPAIDESELALTSALGELEYLRNEVFADLRVELLHGRRSTREKDEAMARFARGEAHVLLATTVVEVGVDVPNASVMVVLDAHRYGLAQMHQLRGRVGRGLARSYCILVAPDERADLERLEILARSNDGFEIAEADLRLRGFGEVAGTAQAGELAILGDAVRDYELYALARADAQALVAADPLLERPEHVGLRARLAGEPERRGLLASS
ncbi:MAG: ATP-dependent DNA helicase RecG [Vulcanimicrobiaceae bacterium]